MFWEWCRFGLASICLLIGMAFMILAVFGVNRLKRALNRMHAAAMGDTLGILFVFLGLIVIFMSYSLIMCVIWVLLQSPDLAITEAAVGAGVTSILFFVTLKKIRAIRKEEQDEQKEG